MAETRQIRVGSVIVGGDAPVSVQSMTCTPTTDSAATLAQIDSLKTAGCEIVRVALPDVEAVSAFGTVVERSPLPVIADIHFDWRLALAALDAGAAGVRINPGTIGSEAKVRDIVRAAAEHHAIVRIGVNSGSLPRDLRDKAGEHPAEAMVEAALGYAGRFDDWGFRDYKISVKSSSVPVAGRYTYSS